MRCTKWLRGNLIWSRRAKLQGGKKDSVLHLQCWIKKGEVTWGGKIKGMMSRPRAMRALCFLSLFSMWSGELLRRRVPMGLCHHHHCLGKQGDSGPCTFNSWGFHRLYVVSLATSSTNSFTAEWKHLSFSPLLLCSHPFTCLEHKVFRTRICFCCTQLQGLSGWPIYPTWGFQVPL